MKKLKRGTIVLLFALGALTACGSSGAGTGSTGTGGSSSGATGPNSTAEPMGTMEMDTTMTASP